MNFNYNNWDEIETTQINLLGIDEVPICPLISIDKDTVKFEHNLQDYDNLEFEIKKYVNDDNGEAVIVQGYDNIHLLNKIVLPKLGKFIVSSEPEISYSDGMEKKVVSCKSLEYELSFKDIKEFKINTGETSSYERLYPENIDAFGHTINFIQFYNPDDSRYSLLDIICNQLGGNWKVGHVDKLLQTKKYYFDVENQDIYSFLMQDVSSAFKCIFQFNTINRTINAYLGENLGEDTGVIIGYRNLLSSTDITQATDEIYTKFTVVGSDDLDIAQVNFGESQIEDLSYFMNEKFLSKDLIKKYNNWIKVREEKRTEYVNKIKEFISNQESRDNIINLVPLDSLEYDWNTFSKDELDREQAYFEDLVKAIEKEFTDDSDNLDMNALKNSIYWLDYQSYTEWIIPNIKIAKENLLLPDDDKKDYLDGWKYDWELYGTNELKVMMETFDNQMQSAKGYEKAWSELTEDEQKKYINQTTYDTIHEQYAKAKEHYNGASAQYDKLIKEVDTYQAKLDTAQTEMNTIAASVNIKNSDFGFTEHELKILSMLYIESDYSNENFLVTTIMTQVDKIDEELKLLDEAKTELSERSRPQYSFSCNLDNLFNLPEFTSWHSEVEVGNFIRLETTEAHQEKLRITSISFNPCKRDNDLSINFANMIISRGNRSDLSTLFDSSYSSSKNGISYGSSSNGDADNNYDDLLKFILNSRKFNDKLASSNLDSLVANDVQIKNAVIDYASIDQVDTLVLNAVTSTVNLEFVKNLIVGHITADDIFSTNTTTNFMTIGTDSKGNKIQINANTIQFVNSDGVVYIQLGIDGTGNVSFLLRNNEGNIIISPNGITQDAIPDGLIVSDMIKKKDTNYNGISSDALDINSVIKGINDNGNLSISSANVYFDDKTKTLNTVLTQMEESVHSVEGKMLYTVSINSSNGTAISDIQSTDLTAVIYNIGTLDVATDSFIYTWYKNGILIDRANSNVYSIMGSDFTNGAQYTCKVSYDSGSITGSIIISKTGKDIVVSDNAPANPQNGDLWYDSANKVFKCYDEENKQWISDKTEDLYGELTTNYYNKTETDNKVTSIIGQSTQIVDPDGNPVTLKSVYSQTSQMANGFSWLVSGDGNKTEFYITDDGISSILSNKTFNEQLNSSIENSETLILFKQDYEGFKTTVSTVYTTKEETQVISTIVTQTSNKLGWLVKSGTDESNFELTDRTAELIANDINLNGRVTFSGLNSETQNKISEAADAKTLVEEMSDNIYTTGTTTIDGGKITTNTITAKQIDVADLFAQNITATGTITGANLRSATIETTKGTIAGWDIEQNAISKALISGKTKYKVSVQTASNLTDTTAAFAVCKWDNWTSDDNQPDFPFYVRYDGTVKATTGVLGGFEVNSERFFAHASNTRDFSISSRVQSGTYEPAMYIGIPNSGEYYYRLTWDGQLETSTIICGDMQIPTGVNSDGSYTTTPVYSARVISVRSGTVGASTQYSGTYSIPNNYVSKVVVIASAYNVSYADGEHQVSGSGVIELKPSATTTTTIANNSKLKIAVTAFTGGGIRLDKTGTNATSCAINYTLIYLP